MSIPGAEKFGNFAKTIGFVGTGSPCLPLDIWGLFGKIKVRQNSQKPSEIGKFGKSGFEKFPFRNPLFAGEESGAG